MHTSVAIVDPENPQAGVMARAAEVLRRGGVVAFPTETVYGLGAAALDEAAVQRIFAAKGRPANNPLIVHVTNLDEARRLTTAWPAEADRLTAAFWPGPLSIVLPKASCVPAIVTAGAPTVALRMPAHPVARALIDAARTPLAAPSANPSTRVSATRARHVLRMLDGRIDLILDGGPTAGGLESTVIDLSGPMPRVLRLGLVEVGALESALGRPIATKRSQADEHGPALPSPGMLKKHYSPSVPLELIKPTEAERVREAAAGGESVGWLTCGPRESAEIATPQVEHVALSSEPAEYARRLYEVLHAFEERGVSRIFVERPPTTAAWAAVQDRLERAAAR